MISCKFENGNDAALRHACANIIILNEARDAVLLTRRAPGMVAGGLWCVPGGYLERNQRVDEAAVREAREETGYDVSLLGLVGISDTPERGDNGRQNIVFFFAATATIKTVDADTESTEQQWFPLSSLPPKESWAFDHLAMVMKYVRSGVLCPPESAFLQSTSAQV